MELLLSVLTLGLLKERNKDIEKETLSLSLSFVIAQSPKSLIIFSERRRTWLRVFATAGGAPLRKQSSTLLFKKCCLLEMINFLPPLLTTVLHFTTHRRT